MSNNSTQKYLDNERQSNFLTSLLPSDTMQSMPATIMPIQEEVDIDVDIEIKSNYPIQVDKNQENDYKDVRQL